MSPNSTDIAFATLNEATNKEEVEKGYTAFEITNNDMFVSSKPLVSHIWLANTETAETRRLTDGTWTLPQVIPPSAPSSPFSWSPDGKSILFVKVESPYSGDAMTRSIQLLNVADSTFKPLTKRTKLEAYLISLLMATKYHIGINKAIIYQALMSFGSLIILGMKERLLVQI